VSLGEGLKAVADAQHQSSGAGKTGDFLHDGAETGHGPGAQIVTVGEPPRQDDAVGALEVVIFVPEVVWAGFGEGREDVMAS